MSTHVHGFDWPDRFVVGTLGQPGARTFYLQARAHDELVSVSLEKEQSTAIADRMEEVLDDLMTQDGNPYSIPALAPPELADNDPLDEPVNEQFRVGALSLGWDSSTGQVVIEAFPYIELSIDEFAAIGSEPIEIEPEQAFVVRIPVGAARAFAKRTREVAGAGRPLCTLCGEPMDSEDHVCELPDGFR